MSNPINKPNQPSEKEWSRLAVLEPRIKFDSVNYRHSVNVANLSTRLLDKSRHKLDEKLVYYAGLYHDIGKSIMPITIIKKEIPLSFEEFDQLKEHARQGFRIIQKYDFPPEILFAALLHHEKYDGSGYPIGLRGEEIPAIARIITICDVFDALTSEKPYRNAHSQKKALQIMEQSSSQYDPDLFHQFLSLKTR